VHELDAASNNSVEDIRTLTEQVRFAPQAGNYKVYIIDEVHMLSPAAFNAFLKTLEEPPPYAIFILATTEKHKILPTILSRCQIFDFKRITLKDTVDHLKEICGKEHIKADPDALHLIAQKTDGCMRDSLSTLDKIVSFTNGDLTYTNTLEHLNILDYDYYFRLMEDISRQDAGAALLLLDEVLQKGFEGDHFLEGLAAFIRDLLVCKDQQVIRLLEVSDNLKVRYEQVSRETDTALLVSALSLLNEAAIQYRTARNKRLQVEMCLIRLSYLNQAVQLISDEKTGAVSKKKVTDPLARAQQLRPPLPRAVLLMEEMTQKPAAPGKADDPETPAPEAAAQVSPHTETQKATPAPAEQPSAPGPSPRKPAAEASSRTSGKLDLSAIMEHVEQKATEEASLSGAAQPIPLEEPVVLELWKSLITRLKQAEKIQVATNLEMSEVSLSGPEEVLITCRNELVKNFVDDEKPAFSDALKARFQNQSIVVSSRVDDSLRQKNTGPKVLSQREQFEQMMEKYPLVRALKENLHLDLG
jgi:DNA polymerase-3 subunit gamma/tau